MAEPTAEEIREAVENLLEFRDLLPRIIGMIVLTEQEASSVCVLLAAAESAATDRERADANERDAGRWRALSKHTRVVDDRPLGWTVDGGLRAYNEDRCQELDALADALAEAPEAEEGD